MNQSLRTNGHKMTIYTLPVALWLIFPFVSQPDPSFRRVFESTVGRRIINGNFAHKGQFPFFAEVINFQPEERTVICGGALISERKVITADHCLKNSVGIGVRLGSTRKHQGKPFVVARQVKHPSMDFLVLVLESPVVTEEKIEPIRIMQRPVISGEVCTAIGFGWDGKDYSKEMKFAELHINHIKDVQALVSYGLLSQEIYAGMNDNSDVCFGDSGGPLLCQDGLAGITLGSIVQEPCNSPGLPSKFADLYKLQQWINSVRV